MSCRNVPNGLRASRGADRRAKLRNGEAGVSLIEVMVVLVLIAVASSFAVLQIGGDRASGAQAEAVRMAALLRAAQDRALLSGSPEWIEWDQSGYVITPAHADGERASGGRDAPVRRNLPGDLRLISVTEPVLSGNRLEIREDGVGATVSWRISEAGVSLGGEGAADVLFDGVHATARAAQ